LYPSGVPPSVTKITDATDVFSDPVCTATERTGMAPSSQRHPLIAGVLGAVAVVAITVAFRGDAAGSPPNPVASVTVEVPRTAPADGGPAGTLLSVPADQVSPLALGRRLVTDADRRVPATSFEVATASYGDGSTFSVRSGSSNSITVVYFVAAWCPTCGPEAVALRELHDQYKATGLRVLIVDVDQNETEGDLAGFREQTGNGEHLWAMDRDFTVARALEVNILDATVVIDQRGRIAYRDGSPTDYSVLAAVVEALLEEDA
jgi:peroxiredoxin